MQAFEVPYCGSEKKGSSLTAFPLMRAQRQNRCSNRNKSPPPHVEGIRSTDGDYTQIQDGCDGGLAVFAATTRSVTASAPASLRRKKRAGSETPSRCLNEGQFRSASP